MRGAVVQIGPACRGPRSHRLQPDARPTPSGAPTRTWFRSGKSTWRRIRKSGSSTGAIVAVEAVGAYRPGWGAPIYGKLDAELAGALMSINAAKGVEIGAGFAAAALTGEDNADEMRAGNGGKPVFLSNSGRRHAWAASPPASPITARVAFKPTSSILTPRRTINEAGEEIELRTKGRHDPVCRPPRGSPVVEAMVACVLADAYLRHRGQVGLTA